MENNQQELIFKLSMFEQQIQQLQQQLQAVEQSMVEMNSLNLGLDEIKGAKGKEIFAQIGRGIFAKTKLLSEDLTVDIGGKNLVKKTVPETKKLIEEQINKLKDVQGNLNSNMDQISGELQKTLIEAQKQEKK
ncbi:prefoldin subunit alpha [Candidatus Pacearchaeota archaeon]|jgi:prefoldin alpha subunit|nr:prefoldin subunit alpha [Candidatus Pacearchaeota archaeon]|tara:strand:- start:19370 stop:19768 length:399 start_codon:yes stop_codon:yes gene_type:complete